MHNRNRPGFDLGAVIENRCVRVAITWFGALLVAGWAVLLSQLDVNCDEVEHAHVAWLIGARGLTPLKDFFQHHQPMIWDVLSTYYRAGGTGPGVLYFGRFIVAIGEILSVWGLMLIGRHGSKRMSSTVLAGFIGIAMLLVMSTMREAMFLTRPESLATPLAIFSVYFWLQSKAASLGTKSILLSLIAGVLFGLSLFASPRFLLIGPLFLLLPGFDTREWRRELRSLATLFVGAATAWIAYLSLSYESVSDVIFNIIYSVLLQQLGATTYPLSGYYWFLGLCTLGFMASFRPFLAEQLKKLSSWSIAYFMVAFVVAILMGLKFPYDQQFTALVLVAVILLSYWQGLARFPTERWIPAVISLVLAVSMVLWNKFDMLAGSGTTLTRYVEQLDQRLATIPHGGKVILGSPFHPIAVDDASYYIFPLLDSPNRLCRAIDLVRDMREFPRCDYAAEIREKRPVLLQAPYRWPNGDTFYASGRSQEDLDFFVAENYSSCHSLLVLQQ